MTRTLPRTPTTAPTPPGATPSCPSLAPLRSQNSTQEASMNSNDYVEHPIRQSLTQQGKTWSGRPVFNITVRRTYNRLCGIPHNRFGRRTAETAQRKRWHRAAVRPHNLIADPAFLLVAWDRVRGNKGAKTAGVDGRTAVSIAAWTGVEEFLGGLRASL